MTNLRHCHVCGPSVKHAALLMHRLDGYLSAFDRVVWLCGVHWAKAQVDTGVSRNDGVSSLIRENVQSGVSDGDGVLVMLSSDAVERVLEAVA